MIPLERTKVLVTGGAGFVGSNLVKRLLREGADVTVLDDLFRCTVTWLAPLLCFTAEEAWLARYPDATSVHLEGFQEVPAAWRNNALAEKWRKVRAVRRPATPAD